MKPQQGLELMSILGWAFCLHSKRPSLSLNHPVCSGFFSKLRRPWAETTAQAPPLQVPFASQVCQSHTDCFIRDRRVGNLSKSGTKVMRTLVRLTHMPEAPGLPGRHLQQCVRERPVPSKFLSHYLEGVWKEEAEV